MIVLDASALLAVLLREPGGEPIKPRLPEALMSAANLAEVLSRFAVSGEDLDDYVQESLALGVQIAPVTTGHAVDAAACGRSPDTSDFRSATSCASPLPGNGACRR